MISRNNRKIAIIIPTYQALTWIGRCLQSIKDLQLPVEYKVVSVVVDNASIDGTREYLKQQLGVKFLPQEKNLGFTGANNAGLQWAENWGADYVMLLNQDAYLTPEAITLLVDFLEEHQKATAVQPQILLYPKIDQINTLGGAIHFLGFGSTTECFKTKLPSGIIREIAYVSGAACLYRLDQLVKIGYFYEPLFLYHEDLDLGWVTKLQGGRSFMISSAVVYHEHEFSRNPQKYYYLERNRWLVLLQNYHWLTLVGLLPALILCELFIWYQSIRQGWFKKKIKAAGYFSKFSHWQFIYRRRFLIQKQRQFSDYEVTKLFNTEFDYREANNIFMKLVINPLMAGYWWLLRLVMFW